MPHISLAKIKMWKTLLLLLLRYTFEAYVLITSSVFEENGLEFYDYFRVKLTESAWYNEVTSCTRFSSNLLARFVQSSASTSLAKLQKLNSGLKLKWIWSRTWQNKRNCFCIVQTNFITLHDSERLITWRIRINDCILKNILGSLYRKLSGQWLPLVTHTSPQYDFQWQGYFW